MFRSSKLYLLMKILNERFVDTNSKDKIVIVSEWVSYLDVIETHVSEIGFTCGKYFNFVGFII